MCGLRSIECNCGMWEEMPSDEPRKKSQAFEFVRPINNNGGIYKCECGKLVFSKVVSVEELGRNL